MFELTYRYVVPSVRRALAGKLVEKGMLRREAAELLGLSRSAVSRYLNSERGVLIKIAGLEDVMNLVEKLAENIIQEEMDEYRVQEEIAKIATYFMSKKYFCGTHKKINPTMDIVRCRICSSVFGK
ncbi:MAG: helix-turn-helix domain-containing protein [Candidatus Brockarchaeota archaeon]|nr:helix-turn-helix domain-containing protein [Candidatus Brockarchaeota archaeon]